MELVLVIGAALPRGLIQNTPLWEARDLSSDSKTGNSLFIVRLYDMFDGWIDVTGPLSKEEAQEKWNELTFNGRKMTKYADGDYYAIFPADTKMLHTPEFRGR